MKNVCLINGSLRGKESSSLSFLNSIKERLPDPEYCVNTVNVKARVNSTYPSQDLEALAKADAIITAFPLHAYCLPGSLMKLLEDFYRYAVSGGKYNKEACVYAVVNCAFHDPEINREAVRVIQNFCGRLEIRFRFAVAIGGGIIVAMTKNTPVINWKLNKAFAQIVRDIQKPEEFLKDFYIKPIIPKFVMMRVKDSKWAKNFMNKKSAISYE
jgi:hypothetical protein